MASTVTKTVLIVDDNASIRQALCELFKHEADFAVCGDAENGKEAIEKAKEYEQELSSGGSTKRHDERFPFRDAPEPKTQP